MSAIWMEVGFASGSRAKLAERLKLAGAEVARHRMAP